MNPTIDKTLGTSETSIAMLKVLADNSFDSILITDATTQGRIIYANKSFKKLRVMSHLESLERHPGSFRVREPIRKL